MDNIPSAFSFAFFRIGNKIMNNIMYKEKGISRYILYPTSKHNLHFYIENTFWGGLLHKHDLTLQTGTRLIISFSPKGLLDSMS